MKIFYSPEFLRKYKQLPEEVKEKMEKREKVFRKDLFDAQLKTHKLKGRLSGFWAFCIDFKYRIIFKFVGKNAVRFYTIGGHSIYF